MAELVKPDICVIGAGSGGLSVAAAAAALGVAVVLIEKGRMGGGGLHAGSVPSKALIAAARRAHTIPAAAPFGVTVERSEVDFKRVLDHARDVIAAIAPNDSKERFGGLGVRVIEGVARFSDRRTVVVGAGISVRARRFIIATGSSPAVPLIAGLDGTPHHTNETIFHLTERPGHLIVIGAGAIGLELAQAFRRIGSAVTVLDAAQPLPREDPECVAVVLDQLEREGIVVRNGISIARVGAAHGGVEVVLDEMAGEGTITGSHLLVATGRRPNVDGLGLAEARIKSKPGGIVVDRLLRTSNKRVYAIGDVIGGPLLDHAATYHAGLVIQNVLLRQSAHADDTAIPRVTFTDPELAQTGLTEAEARRRRYAIRVLRWPYYENDRARAERETRGHIKVVTDRSGQILGATIVGGGAGELITTFTLAVSQKLNIRAIAGIVVPYPTLAEIGKRAALTYLNPSLTRPWVRRIMGLLRRFG